MSSHIFFLNRPEVQNAFDLETAKNFLDFIKKNKNRCVALASENSKVFCSGGDLKQYSKMKKKSEGLQYNKKITKILDELNKTPKIIISAVEGSCIGGGCELILATDYILTSQNARFAFKQSSLNLTPGWGGAHRLLKRVRPGIALDWLTSGRWISAQEAHSQGFVDEVVESQSIKQRVEDFVKEHSSVSDEVVLGLKSIIHSSLPKKAETKVFDQLWGSADHLKALKKFLNSN